MSRLLSWEQITKVVNQVHVPLDRLNGPRSNSQATLRLFGSDAKNVSVTLYRDHHAWCPYCQKIWLWLEAKRVPYRIEKISMFCYGDKEPWYQRLCRSGMLPAVKIDNRIITESDDILMALENKFGALHASMTDSHVIPLRRLERLLFRAWCQWLCYPARGASEESANRVQFEQVVQQVELSLSKTKSHGPFFLDKFSVVDCVFTPYVERMNASLFYYKGFLLRDSRKWPNLAKWFNGLEQQNFYIGTQSDFHTHVHDLPPQMGGCYHNGTEQQLVNQNKVDSGLAVDLPDTLIKEPQDARFEAAFRVLTHRESMLTVNPFAQTDEGKENKNLVDTSLRCALTYLVNGESVCPPFTSPKSAMQAACSLRYIKDRVSVPRDMSVWAARRLRSALEHTAELSIAAAGLDESEVRAAQVPISSRNRRDQNPRYLYIYIY